MSANNGDAGYLQPILREERLDDSNYLDWINKLRNILRSAGKLDLIENPTVDMTSSDSMQVTGLMLSNMGHQLREDLQFMSAFEMIKAIRNRFRLESYAGHQRITKLLITCKMDERTSINSHLRKLRGYLDRIAALGSRIQDNVALNFILMSLPPYESFIKDHCNISKDMEISITDMHRMLTDDEKVMHRKGDAADRKLRKSCNNSKLIGPKYNFKPRKSMGLK